MEPLRYTNKSVENGISEKEALLRQKEYGLNEIKSKNVNAINILLRQFKSPFFYLLFVAVIVSFLIGERIESLAVLAFVIINVIIRFFQEYRAERAVLFLNKLANTSQSAEKKGSYEKNIVYFSKLILKIVSVTIILIFALNIFLKGINSFFELLFFSVALIVSILPEALPVVVTFNLSRGSLKMAKENVVVKRLSAVEDLGDIEVLCTDKTGILTENKLSLENIN